MAARLDGYTLADRATWLRAGTSSVILVDNDPQLFNPYEIVLVNPANHPHVNVAAATAFIDWLLSPDGKASIGSHQVNGEQMFIPAPGLTN
jgi:tungstate transport system substrate-binding protein